MLFNSLDFLIFFPVVFLIFLAIPAKARQLWLLVCSYFFYMCWNPWCIILILLSTVITFGSGIFIEKADAPLTKKLVVAVSFISNLGILFYFKYFNFILDTICRIGRRDFTPWDIVLPVGISFYTFQALGYTVDCYRGTVKPEKNFIRYALFVSFFPQLVAGPIERSSNLLSQIDRLSVITRKEILDVKRLQQGFILMVWGMFLKLVIADRVAILVNNVYDNVTLYGSCELLLAFFGFGLQIYCDFASYSTIAIGAARILTITLMENFDAPYFATSVNSFWKKWHISLSSWFRDYLYIPLGGNRKGTARKLLNLMIVFTCSGLWHGANWTFVFWGMLHGLAQVLENLLKPWWRRLDSYFEVNKNSAGFMIMRAIPVTLFVDLCWVFFRADNFTQARLFITRLFTRPDWWHLFDGRLFELGLDVNEMWILAASVMFMVIVDFIRARKKLNMDQWLISEFAPFRILVVAGLIMVTVMFGQYGPGFDSQQFIYFQF